MIKKELNLLITKYFCVFFTATIISCYWVTVVIKSILITPKIGKTPNVIPYDWKGLLSRLFTLPLIMLWIIIPWYTLTHPAPITYPKIAYLGTLISLSALILTFYCWHYMGINWRIGIDYQEKTTLLNSGPFKKIRHPIYTLSMLLMLGTCLVMQTNLAIILLCAHLFLFSLEAIREEQHMIQKHPLDYVNYIKQTGRFFPKLFTK